MPPEWLERFAAYRHGTGLLVFDAKVGVGVDWELVQTVAGGLFLLVRANGSTTLGASDLATLLALVNMGQLNGFDSRGFVVRVETNGRVNPVHAELADDWATLRVVNAESVARDAAHAAFRFAITNLSTDEPPAASFEINGTRLVIAPVANYETVVSTLYTRDRIALTTTLTVESPDRAAAVEIAETFCGLASYAAGCRIAWLHLEGLDAEGNEISEWLISAITGAFVRLPLIDEKQLWAFIKDTWDSYSKFRSENLLQARRLLGMMMNATATDDFLELRGLKLASTVDALTTIVLPERRPRLFASNSQESRFMSSARKCIRTKAEEMLPPDPPNATGRRKELAEKIAAKASDLLRPAFRELIEELCNALQISIAAEDVQNFITSRNELVHEASFVSQRSPSPSDWPFETAAAEYFWMLRFVDRLVLRTIGYRGLFIDRYLRDSTLAPAEANGVNELSMLEQLLHKETH